MTLGSSPSPLQVLQELGESLPYTFPDAKTRWLADVGASDLITFPTSFANKTSVKIAGSDTASVSGNSHTFSSINFGNAFSGRILVACVGLYSASSVVLDQTSCTIGGFGATGGDAGEKLGSGPSCGAGIWATGVSTGTSGDVTINWSGGSATHAGLVLLSVASISTTPDDETASWSGGGSGGTSDTATLDIPSNGVLIVSFAHANTNNTTLTGVTERTEITFGSARLCVGFDNRKDAQSGDSVGASWSGSTAYGGEARSYSQ